ncbi:MAG TPA: dTDP-4-dehydrorhamnose reductase [Moraxellaceae bacterium]
MKILLTGKNGQVGWELQRSLCTLGDVVALGSAELDLADADAIVSTVRAIKPDLIVNPAAYTAVDKAEAEPDLALAVNGRAPGILAEEARRLGALLVHYSTDYVFDGSNDLPWRETDAPAPLNVYGNSKLQGEQALAAVGGRHLILRTSWVYGARGRNFFLTMRKLLQERQELKVVADQIGAPTSSRLLAELTAQLLVRARHGDLPPLLHAVAAGSTSWFGFAEAIARDLRGRGRRVAELHPIPSSGYPVPARRPLNSRLDISLLESVSGNAMPDWRQVLALVLEEAGDGC